MEDKEYRRIFTKTYTKIKKKHPPKNKKYLEDVVQKAIVRWLRFNGFLCTSQGAGLIISARTQRIANMLGYLKGSPDLIVWIRGGSLGIECKAPKTMKYSSKSDRMIQDKAEGKQSDTQKDFEKAVTSIPGHHYIVASDLMDVVRYIKENGIQPR